MAKKTRRDQWFERLPAQGLRKRTAELIGTATDRRRKPAKRMDGVLAGVKRAASDVEDRLSGGPEKRKASAKKAANTRKRNAQRRSESAKKGAQTRAKGRSTGR